MKTDILIIVGGLTGLAAAYEIIENSDLQVTLLRWGAGASAYIHGFCLPIGEDDSEELFYRDSMASGYGQSRPSLVRRLCKDSMTLPAYFQRLGVQMDREGAKPRLIKSLGSSVARIAGIGNNTGPVVCAALEKRLRESGRFTQRRDLRALELIKKEDRVIGIRCYDQSADSFRSIYAGLVILACGGFGKLYPESTNSADIGGDGCAMAYLAGGQMTDMEFVQFEPSAAIWPEALAGKSIITTMFYEGAVLRGGDGGRFMLRSQPQGECVPKDVQAICISREIRRGNSTPHGGVWFDATAVPQEKWDTVYKPYLNRYLAQNIDLRKEPVEIAPAAHTTCGGVCIDENCRTGIAGLLACGEVTGGLHGANRLGGNAGLETMVFGRIAGQTALADWQEIQEGKEDLQSNRPARMEAVAMRRKLQQILRRDLGVIRTEKELREGLCGIDELLRTLTDHRGCYEEHRLYNDLLTARMALSGALRRKGSIGCHFREDSVPEVANRVIIRKKNGQMTVYREEI